MTDPVIALLLVEAEANMLWHIGNNLDDAIASARKEIWRNALIDLKTRLSNLPHDDPYGLRPVALMLSESAAIGLWAVGTQMQEAMRAISNPVHLEIAESLYRKVAAIIPSESERVA